MLNKCLVLLVFSLGLCGCFPAEDYTQTLSFWTDVTLTDNEEYALFVNGIPVGRIDSSYISVDCETIGIVAVEVIDDQDMNLEIKTADDNGVYLGLINLYAPSSGIKVKPETNESIFVQHDLDEKCTRVRLRW